MKRFARIMLMVGIAIGVGAGTVFAGSLLTTATSGEDWIWFEGGDGYILFRGNEGKQGGMTNNPRAAINFFETDNTLELTAWGDVLIEGGKDVVIVLGE